MTNQNFMCQSLPVPSDEQREVLHLFADNNVICDSVAGSGKTTTILHLAQAYPDRRFMLFTYNQRLKEETRIRAIKSQVKNLEVHNYHSFIVKYYSKNSYTDVGLSAVLADKECKPLSAFKFDSLILDETQDMTPLYYRVIYLAIRDNISASFSQLRICVFGDKHQSIFKYNHADERFIIFANKLFENGRPWKTTQLRTSYRITKPMCEFLNKTVLHDNRMSAVKESQNKVRYIVCNCFSDRHRKSFYRNGEKQHQFGRPFEEIMYYVDECQFDFEDIFVLAPSVKSDKSQIRQLANEVSNILEIPIFVPISDEERIDPQVIQGKMVFSTFHQVKGLERKVVIVMNFDDFMPTMKNLSECPNELYVALTRATERMSIFHHYQNNYLGFLNLQSLRQTCHVELHKNVGLSHTKGTRMSTFKVTDLTRHLSLQTLQKAMEYILVKEICSPQETIHVPTKSLQGDLFESTSEINGIAIPAFFAYTNTGNLPILPEHLRSNFKRKDLTPSFLLELSNKYCSERSQYVYKLNQIKEYDWLNDELLSQCNRRLLQLIPEPSRAKFEHEVKTQIGRTTILGAIDCVDEDNTLWEFKCTTELVFEDYLQLAVYAFLYPATKYKLANILSGQVYEICTDGGREKLHDLVEFLIYQKFNRISGQSDKDFISAMNTAKAAVLNREQYSEMHDCVDENGVEEELLQGFGKCML